MSEVHLRDLSSLLRSHLGNDLIVDSYVTKDLLPPGENYGSKIISIHAIIRRSENEDSEDLHLVAKLPPITEFQREVFDSPFTFRKEIFMYSELLPFYRKLEVESGISEDKIVDISPKYYGSRLSLNPDKDFDDDAAILLENLKPRGYYCTERRHGCDIAHAQLALRALAKFHALGMVIKEKKPEFFEAVKLQAKCMELKIDSDFDKSQNQRLQDIADDPEIAEHYDDCARIVKDSDPNAWIATPDEPWSTIIHSDFWTNNIMFHKSAGIPDDVKFVDYQNYLFLSPGREVTFFVGIGLNAEAAKHLDELIDLYYDTLIGLLKKLDCDIGKYTRESFDETLRATSRIEFVHSLWMVKIVTMDVDAEDPGSLDMKNLIEHGKGKAYKERLRDLVMTYHQKGWLLKSDS